MEVDREQVKERKIEIDREKYKERERDQKRKIGRDRN